MRIGTVPIVGVTKTIMTSKAVVRNVNKACFHEDAF